MDVKGDSEAPQGYDLLIVTDATASMGSYLRALNESLPEIIRISQITACFDNIGVIAYRDYCGGKLLEWSGWYGEKGTTTQESLLEFCSRLRASHGGDWPEATKTGLHKAHEVMNQRTIVVLYSDAPPHMPATGGNNRDKEIEKLKGTHFTDWVSASAAMAKRSRVYALIQSPLADTLSPYMYLCHKTGGACFELKNDVGPAKISELTISLLLSWMGIAPKTSGQPATGSTVAVTATNEKFYVAKVKEYKDTSFEVKKEGGAHAEKYWVHVDTPEQVKKTKANITERWTTLDGLRDVVRVRKESMQDFSTRYKSDEKYRSLVVGALQDIIDNDVKAMTVNPIFGTLWRTVCSDRLNEARDGLISSFGLRVDKIDDPDTKQRMKNWLEESYDYKGEILAMLSAVDEEEKYPCVFLDPTLDFGEGENNIRNFTREELLEIGRSCDYRVLRRLGKVLTRLTYVNSAGDLPAHVKEISDDQCPKLPLALAQGKHNCKFWKVLLHLILEGTMITPRPAALLAALSLKMGIAPLRETAEAEMLRYKNKWNTLDIPETWNTSCLSLILDADADHRERSEGAKEGLIKDDEKVLFQTLVDYKMLEHNLETTLTARIGWHPEKIRAAIGPLSVCKKCKHPRSVTIMAENGVCGLCVDPSCPCGACASFENPEECLNANVSEKEGTWVECFDTGCRAQYVVYNHEKLNVRAKCFYCRHGAIYKEEERVPAPTVECTKCLSRMIWPKMYRPNDLDVRTWKCPPCDANRVTIIDYETTAKKLAVENGNGWLLKNEDNKIEKPLAGGSLFKTLAAAGVEDFARKVNILPGKDKPEELRFTIRGKCVRNNEGIISTLDSWVRRRKAEQGTCNLCFSDTSKKGLRSACGRKSCGQDICEDCRTGWFGINKPGNIINTAALSCPFCRRLPAPKVVRRYGIHALPGLKDAVARSGEFIFAWCASCGYAKEFMERVCARGAPQDVGAWECGECIESKGKMKKGGYRECPGCKTMTQKLEGCDHITCPVDGCGKHWCWNCGFSANESSSIYGHMEEEHGGLYGVDTEDEYYGSE
ncbi:dihydroxyacid dehydratase [Zalerion maritima]|uniref:RBR-type E3 ubiquitin transferase n=1 Tax=Zalerion maritima TaxID=339359 RepID=A0AAD5WN76_9PEZI|nr:dihydroxyacid dehydratase [Zalerion maritima]